MGTKTVVDEAARKKILEQRPKKVVIPIHAMGKLAGLKEKPRDQAEDNRRHKALAEALGLDPNAYGEGRIDCGIRLLDKTPGVRLDVYIADLEDDNFAPTEAFWQKVPKRGGGTNDVSFVVFEREPVLLEFELPKAVNEVLRSRRFNDLLSVWANPEVDDEGGILRSDTVAVAAGFPSEEPSFHLGLEEDGSYSLLTDDQLQAEEDGVVYDGRPGDEDTETPGDRS